MARNGRQFDCSPLKPMEGYKSIASVFVRVRVATPSRLAMPALDIAAHPQAEDYHTAGFGKRIGWGSRPALLLIDVCTAYWKDGSPLDLSNNADGAASPDSMRRLLSSARQGGVPVIWAQVRYNHPQMKDGGVQALKTKTILAWQDGDTRGLDALMPGLEPTSTETVILKRNPSAFFGTTLATELHLLGVDTLVICGVSTSGCVRATAADALCHGFRPMVSQMRALMTERRQH